MRQKTEPYLTSEDYLFLERNAETKSEYFDGETFAMSVASEAHNPIVANLVMVLGFQLKLRPCKILVLVDSVDATPILPVSF